MAQAQNHEFYKQQISNNEQDDEPDLDTDFCRILAERKMGGSIRKTRSQEAVITLLASFGDDVERCAQKFLEQDMMFKELAALSKEDLELLGIKDREKQEQIIETFRELPKQNLTYDEVVNSDDARDFNADILNKIKSHLNSMSTSISATNLKLRVRPSSDVVLEDKTFASKYVLEAMGSITSAVEEIELRLSVLEATIEEKEAHHKFYFEVAIIAGVAAMTAGAYYWRCR